MSLIATPPQPCRNYDPKIFYMEIKKFEATENIYPLISMCAFFSYPYK